MRQLDQNTCTISRFGITAARAAVFHVFEHGKGIVNDLVGFMTVDIGYKTSPAGIVFKFGPVKPLVAFCLVHRRSTVYKKAQARSYRLQFLIKNFLILLYKSK